MAKSIPILITLVIMFGQGDTKLLGKDNFTSEWTIHTRGFPYPPVVTETEDLLIYVSFPSDNTIKLETSKIVNKPCEIPSSVRKNNTIEDIIPLNTETLGNGKIVVALLEMKPEFNSSNVWIYVIEPVKCTFKVDNIYLDGLTDPEGSDLMSIIPYNNTFSIFLNSNGRCKSNKICSLTYTDELELIEEKKDLLGHGYQTWDVIPSEDYNPDKGYLHVAAIDNSNTTILELLAPNFTIIKHTELNYSNNSIYWFSEEHTVSLCASPSNQQLDCIQLDSELNTLYETSVFYDYYIQFLSLFNLPSGQLVIITILSQDSEDSDYNGFIQYIDNEGKSSPAIQFYPNILCDVTDMNVFEMKNDVFCVTIICHDSVNTKCISSKDRREF